MKCKQQIIFKANQSSSPYFVGDTILNLGQNPSNSDQTSKNLQVYIGFLIFRYHHIMANLKWSPAKNYATNISPFIYGSKMKQTSVFTGDKLLLRLSLGSTCLTNTIDGTFHYFKVFFDQHKR